LQPPYGIVVSALMRSESTCSRGTHAGAPLATGALTSETSLTIAPSREG